MAVSLNDAGSCWSLQFLCKIVVEKNEDKQEEAGDGSHFLKRWSHEGPEASLKISI